MQRILLPALPWFFLVAVFSAGPIYLPAQPFAESLQQYLQAVSASERQKSMTELLKQQPSFDSVYHALVSGKTYSPDVNRGFFTWSRTTAQGIPLHALIFIPYDYTPDEKWPVRITLHGDISHLDPWNVFRFIDTTLADYRQVKQIRIYPSGYYAARWYYEIQYHHVMALLDSVKELYNVDENRVALGGFSDGGTGTFAFANYNVTPFQVFMPYIGSAAGLSLLGTKEVYLRNFSNKPFIIVNGARDQTFPPEVVTPFTEALQHLNRNVSCFMLDTFGHTLQWFPLMKDTLDQFLLLHPRNPYPPELFWATEMEKKFNRNHWIVIRDIGETTADDLALTDENRVIMMGSVRQAFPRDTAFGMLEAHASDQRIEVKTKGIRSYSLLISPGQFDFSREISVYTNGILSWTGIPESSVETLLKYHSLDRDRTMLFATELKITVGKKFKGRN